MRTILITGANRGIGYALTQAYLQRGDHVFAACRTPARALTLDLLAEQHEDRLTIVAMDVADTASIRAAYERVHELTGHLDVLINCAGVDAPEEDQTLDAIDFATLLDAMRVNAAAPLIVTQHFLGLLRHSTGAKVVNMSSEMGSIELTTGGGYYAYSASKAALNMISRLLANDLAQHGIAVVPLDPGWVKTDMGGETAPLTPEQSAEGIMRVTDELTLQDSGRFLAYDGGEWEW